MATIYYAMHDISQTVNFIFLLLDPIVTRGGRGAQG